MADQQIGEDPKLRILRVTLTYQACLVSVLVYDWLTCLRKEYKYIWKGKPSLVSALYVLLRYWEFVRESMTLYLATVEFTPEKCAPFGRFQVYSTLPVAAAVSVLFTLRLYALYDRNRILLGVLSVLIAAMLIVNAIAGREFGPITFIEGHGPCFAGALPGASSMVITLWLCPFIYDLLTTTLLVARIVTLRKRGAATGGILSVLTRDGLAYFAIISAANLINVGFFLGAPISIQSINASMPYCVTSVVSSRLVLSLREHASESSPTGATTGVFNATKHAGVSRVNGGDMDNKLEHGFGNVNGIQTHIALHQFGNSTHQKMDDDSLELEDGRQPMHGVYVVKESQVRVDEEKR